jgi:hypothetical protein
VDKKFPQNFTLYPCRFVVLGGNIRDIALLFLTGFAVCLIHTSEGNQKIIIPCL